MRLHTPNPLLSFGRTLFKALNLSGLILLLSTNASGREQWDLSRLEGDINPFLQPAQLHVQQIFSSERFPNVIVALDGTIVASWGNQSIHVRRSSDGGLSWESPVLVANPGFHGGGSLVDEQTGDLLVFVEAGHPPAPLTVYRSRDSGKTWQAQETILHPDSEGRVPSMHMNERGITLRHGPHRGRLLRATRDYGRGNQRDYWPEHITNAIYSDDGGFTWHVSAPFPEKGTGEAAIVELSDGRLYYNSRVHWDQREQNTRRRAAWSGDGGQTWTDWQLVPVLPDGLQHTSYGCMGGLVRLPVRDRDILIYTNLETDKTVRERITAWASFDGGRTWPIKRLVQDGSAAYSSLAAGRPGTPSEGWIYLFYEGFGGGQMVRFRLSWLLRGDSTGDGTVPDWLTTTDKH